MDSKLPGHTSKGVIPCSALFDFEGTRQLTVLQHGTKPDVSNLCVFGCSEYAHVPKGERQKLQSKSKEMYSAGI